MKALTRLGIGVALLSASAVPAVPTDLKWVKSYETICAELPAPPVATSTPIEEEYVPEDCAKGVERAFTSVFIDQDGNLIYAPLDQATFRGMNAVEGQRLNPKKAEYLSLIQMLFAQKAKAAISFDTATQNLATAGTASVTYSHTVTGSNPVIFVGVANQNTSGYSAITYNGASTTQIDFQSDGGVTVVYLLYQLNPATGAHNVSVTRNATGARLYVHSTSYAAVSQAACATPDAKTKGANPGGTNVFVSVTTVADNAWLEMMGYFAAGNGPHAGATSTIMRGSVQDGATTLFDSNGARTPAGVQGLNATSSSLTGSTAYVMASFAPDTCGAAAPSVDQTYLENIDQ